MVDKTDVDSMPHWWYFIAQTLTGGCSGELLVTVIFDISGAVMLCAVCTVKVLLWYFQTYKVLMHIPYHVSLNWGICVYIGYEGVHHFLTSSIVLKTFQKRDSEHWDNTNLSHTCTEAYLMIADNHWSSAARSVPVTVLGKAHLNWCCDL